MTTLYDMAGKKNRILGLNGESSNIDKGTLSRCASPKPGIIDMSINTLKETSLEIESYATDTMVPENDNTCSLDDCLIIPIAAKSVDVIKRYVGSIPERDEKHNMWLFVNFTPLAPPNNRKVWRHGRAKLINASRQCWVHVDYPSPDYREAYAKCFPNINLPSDVCVDHIFNRRLAKRVGYNYVRLIHVSRGVNSSSGRGEERSTYNDSAVRSRFAKSNNNVYYASPVDLLKMLNIKVGGFPLNNVRDKHHLFYEDG